MAIRDDCGGGCYLRLLPVIGVDTPVYCPRRDSESRSILAGQVRDLASFVRDHRLAIEIQARVWSNMNRQGCASLFGCTGDEMLRRVSKGPWLVLVLTVACLIPFAGKAFHIDDTLFLLCARQIQEHPGDFYGFDANWYGAVMPMHEINQNPPLVPYYIAVAAGLFGWSEVALHLSFLLPAVGLSLGMYYLARSFCSRPHLAALIGVFSPAFLVSSTSIMTDVTMVAFYVWAVILWLHGMQSGRSLYLLCSGILICCSMMAKYYGVTAVALLFAYSLATKRRPGLWIAFLMIPLGVLVGYELLCQKLYGSGLFGNAVSYASGHNASGPSLFLLKPLIALSFTGGCIVAVLFYSHLLWSRRGLAIGCLSAAVIAFLLEVTGLGDTLMASTHTMRWYVDIQCAILVVLGAGVVVLAVRDLWTHRNALSLLLSLWVLGTFVFSGFVNWTTNARTILPMAPAVAILVVRKLDEMSKSGGQTGGLSVLLPLSMAAALALLVVWADTTYSNCQRSAARLICDQFVRDSRTVWFGGHWGFQYYMQLYGARALDFVGSSFEEGDIFVAPSNSAGPVPPSGFGEVTVNPGTFVNLDDKEFRTCRFITCVCRELGAGYYTDAWGCMPFSFGPVPPEVFSILHATESHPPLIPRLEDSK